MSGESCWTEAALDTLRINVAGAKPVGGEIRAKLLEPLITATCTAVGEMAGAEVAVQAVYQTMPSSPLPVSPAAAERDSRPSAISV